MTISHTLLSMILLFFTPLSIFAQDIIIDDPTENNGKVAWQWRVSVGDVQYNKPVTAEFVVKNISKEPLIIKDVVVGCHCTIIDYPKDPIQAGATVTIKAIYDAKREGRFYKLIHISTNFDPKHLVTLAMEGTVKSRHN